MGSRIGFPFKYTKMKKLIILLTCIFFTNSKIISQSLNFGLGFELNQTRFRQYAPTITVPFENPHCAGYGLTIYFQCNLKITDKLSIKMSPLIGFYRTNSNVTDAFNLNIYGLRFSPNLILNNFNIELGLEYNRLHSLIGTLPNGKKIDWTFFAHRRDLLGPTINLGYNVFNNTYVFFRSTYFLHDFLSSGALDYDGNIVGPVEVTPYIFAIGVDYNISKSLKNKRKRK